jgi:hypothetical protein
VPDVPASSVIKPIGGDIVLDVQEPDVLCVPLDERAACLHVLAHQHGEQLVGLCGVVEGESGLSILLIATTIGTAAALA